MDKRAYERGRRACVNAKPNAGHVNGHKNPYPRDSAKWEAWEKGWDDEFKVVLRRDRYLFLGIDAFNNEDYSQ